MFPTLMETIDQLQDEAGLISADRQRVLQQLSTYVSAQRPARLNFICTHNSRRSHLAQVWAAVAAHYYGMTHVETFSGGTEATAFNPRAVAALERAGFRVVDPGGENPRYLVHFSDDTAPLTCFSKTYDDSFNPATDFAAVMTCSEADENCPYIPGTNARIALTYEDPKVADDTPAEASRYRERVQQIGREIFWAFAHVNLS
ncbi:MAG: protein-tyrosine-phosphatase [Bacteroidota bacterium]